MLPLAGRVTDSPDPTATTKDCRLFGTQTATRHLLATRGVIFMIRRAVFCMTRLPWGAVTFIEIGCLFLGWAAS